MANTIIITGASKGIGKAIALKYAQNGYELLLCSRNQTELAATAAEIEHTYKVKVHYFTADVSIKEQCMAFVQWCLATANQIGVLINNAGQFVPGSIHNEPDGTLEQMINTNLYSAYHITRGIVPQMITAAKGHVFNICSIASQNAYANGGSYSISKFAMLGFSQNLREELKPLGVKVTAVMPGAVYTNSWSGSGIDPLRIMEANDVAEMVYSASQLSPQAVVEDIVLRPQLGDL
jgi:short-subunit dehydrogenase